MKENSHHTHLDYYVFQNTAIGHLYNDFEQWGAAVTIEKDQQIAKAKLKFLDYLSSYTKERLTQFPMLVTIF